MKGQYQVSDVNHLTSAGRKQAVVIILASSLTIMGSVMIAAMIPKMVLEFAARTPNFNILMPLVITGPALAIALFSPFVGWIIDRFGRKVILIFATLLYCFFGSLPAFLSDFLHIAVSRMLFGLAEATIMVACSTLIADYWKGEARIRLVNFQVVAIGLVGAIFFVLGGILGEQSWRIPFYLYLLPILLVPFMIKLLWEPKPNVQSTEPNESLVPVIQTNFKVLICNYLLIICGMILAFIVPVQTPILLSQMGVQSTTLIGMCAGLGLLASLVGSLIWPLLRNKLGISGTNIILFALTALGLYFLIHATDYKEVVIAVFIHGIAVGLMVPNMMLPVMNAISDKHRGKALGMFTASLYLGQFLSPILVSILMLNVGDLKYSIWLLTIITILIGFVSLILSVIRFNKVKTSNTL